MFTKTAKNGEAKNLFAVFNILCFVIFRKMHLFRYFFVSALKTGILLTAIIIYGKIKVQVILGEQFRQKFKVKTK